MSKYKAEKKIKEDLARGRTPLYVSHATGKITGTPNEDKQEDFGSRLARIRASLDKINRLMSELKQSSREDQPYVR